MNSNQIKAEIHIIRDENINWTWYYKVGVFRNTAYVLDEWRRHKKNETLADRQNHELGRVYKDTILISLKEYKRIDI